MGFLSDVLSFETFHLKEILGKVKDNPERLLIGAVDPAASKVWGKVLGKDYEPIVDQWGGATDQTYAKAEAAGIDTKAGGQMQGVAHTIAQFYAGKYAKAKIGGMGGGANGVSGAGGSGGGSGIGSGGGSGSGSMMSADNLKNIGNAMDVFGNVMSAFGAADDGRADRVAAEYRAAQMRVGAGQELAASQREAITAQQQSKRIASRALAVAAASGGGASDPTVVKLISDISAEGAYRQAIALYEGQDRARTLMAQADATEYEGKLAAKAGNRSGIGGLIKTGASLFGNIAQGNSLQSKYGGSGPQGSNVGPGSSSWGMDLGRD